MNPYLESRRKRNQEIFKSVEAERWKKGIVVIILLTLREGIYVNTLSDSYFNS